MGSYFLSDSKANLQGCSDHWTLKDQWLVRPLYHMNVCVDVRLLTSGLWTAFSYTLPQSPFYDLALQGDTTAVYAWLLGVQYWFPVQLSVQHWHRLCLHRNWSRNTFSLTINGLETHEHTVIGSALAPGGSLLLGCQPWEVSPGSSTATIELYLFRMWDDVKEHGSCEDGTVVGWDSQMWSYTRASALLQDSTLQCGECGGRF